MWVTNTNLFISPCVISTIIIFMWQARELRHILPSHKAGEPWSCDAAPGRPAPEFTP